MLRSSPTRRVLGALGFAWGIGGVLALLGSAVARLAPYAVEAVSSPLSAVQWVALAAFAGFMAYAEGYKGFQKAFSPRVVVRARWLLHHPHALWVLLAPLHCMGLVNATRKRLFVSWSITLMVVVLIIGVRTLAQPWRGIVDAGVVIGLSWGVLAILGWLAAGVLGRVPAVPSDVPDAAPPT